MNHLLSLFLIVVISCFLKVSPIQGKNVLSYDVDTDTILTKQDSLALIVLEIVSLDQGIRDPFLQEEKKERMPSNVEHAIDTLCFNKAVDFIRKYGWPTKELLGRFWNYKYIGCSFTPIMLHACHRMKEKDVHDLLVNEVKKGRLSAVACAYFFDKYWVIYQKKSMYNSPFKQWLPQKGVLKEDKTESDILMKEIGLSPVPDIELIENPSIIGH
ncbi:hypothetical protein SAMN04487851_10228 [Prevotella sp. tc2-28]|jgi:hypothetical protein|uniref:hypothetical protein n=1 Tax=Prevotella sp. tc2-28 TaxID=1761888 RepID=UPI0008984F4A|nr:hypothetical protein [Prevotella sp. tc2-28]SEA02402.1 hypothetical protein SAMN04487851_10228 [Prevotella sp. tc2-28]